MAECLRCRNCAPLEPLPKGDPRRLQRGQWGMLARGLVYCQLLGPSGYQRFRSVESKDECKYFDLYTPAYAAKLDQPLWKIRQWLASTACLVIDEVGTSAWTDARKDRLQQIIDLRTANRLPTIVTTNLAQADFDAAGAERIASRFNQVLYPIKCTWSDFRKRSALKNLKPEEVF